MWAVKFVPGVLKGVSKLVVSIKPSTVLKVQYLGTVLGHTEPNVVQLCT